MRAWTSRREAETGVLREMDRRSSWLSALGREPYMEGEKKLAEMLGRPMPSHRLRSSCKSQIPSYGRATKPSQSGSLPRMLPCPPIACGPPATPKFPVTDMLQSLPSQIVSHACCHAVQLPPVLLRCPSSQSQGHPGNSKAPFPELPPAGGLATDSCAYPLRGDVRRLLQACLTLPVRCVLAHSTQKPTSA